MSTFAVFGMTRHYARQASLKSTPTSIILAGSNTPGGGRRELTEGEWLDAVDARTDRLFQSKRCVQLSALFDTPHFAEDFMKLLDRQCECRDLVIKYQEKVEPKKRSKKSFSLEWREWKN